MSTTTAGATAGRRQQDTLLRSRCISAGYRSELLPNAERARGFGTGLLAKVYRCAIQ